MRFYNKKLGQSGSQPTFKAVYFGVNIFQSQLILCDMDIKNDNK